LIVLGDPVDPIFPDIFVLYVDADEQMRRRVRRTLRRSFVTECIASAAELKAKLAERAWSAVVTDDKLPDGNGRDLLAEIKLAFPDCKRILVSYDEVPVPEDPEAKPWQHLVRKPFNPFRLSRVVESWTRGAKYEGTALCM
jgi:DNA-binding NtrC family response regulator